MIRGRYLMSGEDIAPVLALRRAVFAEELERTDLSIPDEFDDMAVYACVYDEDGCPRATGRLHIDLDDRFLIDMICVERSVRRRGYGDLVVRMLLGRALDMNAPGIYVRSVPNARDFYARYGFAPVEAPLADGRVLMCVKADGVVFDRACGGGCAGCDQSQSPSS